MKETNATVGFISLGCPKALVDSERILTQLRSEGYGLTNHYQDADLVVVNTCGFIDAAVEESLQAIGEALDENGKVIVTGCLGAQSDKVLDKYPNVLGISGPHAYEEVMSSVHENLPAPHEPWNSLIPAEGLKLTPRHYAYLKISEGCNHRCTFCIIPHLRGDLVSRPIGEVMQEAENLANAGVKELLVVSQDTSAYGLDLRYRTDFWNGRPLRTNIHQLAKSLGELDIWIRMHYVYPYPHVDDLIPLMAEGTILPYLDIPLQHGSERVLRAMKRPAATEKVLNRIAHWRDICPDITLRSTFIVGFPGETQAEFDELLDFIREGRLDRVGCFMYSPVDGAPANDLSGEVPEEVKEERFEQFMAVQAEISAERLSEKIGQTIQVLVDEVDEEGVIARGPGDAPEIDGMVYLPQMEGVQPGDFLKVQVTHADEHDLWAQPAE